jgi:uncharacterized repeat protein (TIGR04076 family)
MLEIVVHEIRGECPVYKVGDRIVIADPEIDLAKTDALCTHALSTLLHYALILEHDWCPVKLGLTTAEDEEHAYMQCVDPGKPYTEGGTVIFKCKIIKTRAKTSKGQQDQSNSPDFIRVLTTNGADVVIGSVVR